MNFGAGGSLLLKCATIVCLIAGPCAAMSFVACHPPEPSGKSPLPAIQPSGNDAPAVQPPANDREMIIQSTKAVRWSSKIDEETLRALRTGRRRLIITVNAYDPPTSGAAILVVNLLTAKGMKSKEIDRFGVFPNAAFRASEGVEPKRFEFSLAHVAPLLEDSEIHLEIGFDSSQGQFRGGMAEISVKFVDL